MSSSIPALSPKRTNRAIEVSIMRLALETTQVRRRKRDLQRCLLRPGNVHSAEEWRSVLAPVIARYHGRGFVLYFRGDAAFAKPELYKLLEAEGIGYAILNYSPG